MIVQLHAIVNREFLGDPSTIIGPQDSKASREIWSLSLSLQTVHRAILVVLEQTYSTTRKRW